MLGTSLMENLPITFLGITVLAPDPEKAPSMPWRESDGYRQRCIRISFCRITTDGVRAQPLLGWVSSRLSAVPESGLARGPTDTERGRDVRLTQRGLARGCHTPQRIVLASAASGADAVTLV